MYWTKSLLYILVLQLSWFYWPCCSQPNSNPCLGLRSCGNCIAESAQCGWCGDEGFDKTTGDRCNLLETIWASGCSKVNIFSQAKPPPNPEVSSVHCNLHGTLECGQCTCDKGYYGKNCEVMSFNSRGDQDIYQCMSPSTNIVCSGRGECVAGFCECHPRRANSFEKYSGRYCECDDYDCPYHRNHICGGHGRCICGECICDEGYEGDACGCPISNATCLASNGYLCNGNGDCICGVCKCAIDTHYKGPTCEECPTCPGKCLENKHCAQCVGFHTGPLTKQECEEQCQHVEVTYLLDRESDHTRLCQFHDEEDDCRYYFTYEYVENNMVYVEVQQTKECPGPSPKGQGGNGSGTSIFDPKLQVIYLTAMAVVRLYIY